MIQSSCEEGLLCHVREMKTSSTCWGKYHQGCLELFQPTPTHTNHSNKRDSPTHTNVKTRRVAGAGEGYATISRACRSSFECIFTRLAGGMSDARKLVAGCVTAFRRLRVNPHDRMCVIYNWEIPVNVLSHNVRDYCDGLPSGGGGLHGVVDGVRCEGDRGAQCDLTAHQGKSQ